MKNMKKTILATAFTSVATFGMANAAVVYENEGFNLELKGDIGVYMNTSFAHTTNGCTEQKIKDLKDAGGDALKASQKCYAVANFGAVGKGGLELIPSYKINDGLKVGAKVTTKFDTSSGINLDKVGVSLGGTAILGKLELGSQFNKGSNIKYTFGPMVGFEAYVGAVMPFGMTDNRPATLNPKSASGFDAGMSYELELDKDMTLKASMDYKSRTDDTKRKNSLNPEAYASWQHNVELGLEFKMETIKAELGYEVTFVPPMWTKDGKTQSVKPADAHLVKLNLEVGLMEKLTMETGVEVGLEGANNSTSPQGNMLVGGEAGKALKTEAPKETSIDFKLGLSYEIAKGFSAGAKFTTNTVMTSLGKDAAGNENAKDSQIATQTVPGLELSMKYEF